MAYFARNGEGEFIQPRPGFSTYTLLEKSPMKYSWLGTGHLRWYSCLFAGMGIIRSRHTDRKRKLHINRRREF